MMKNKLKFWLFLAAAVAGCTAVYAQNKQPNVVFIVLDDLGYAQIEAYGRGLDTEDCDPKLLANVEEHSDYSVDEAFRMMRRASPTLSRMADQGIKFNNAFASSNLCASARISIATGILQNRWGIYRNIDAEAHGLKPHSHLAEQLKNGGYATAHIGKWHIGTRDQSLVDQYLEKNGIEERGLSYYQLDRKHRDVYLQLKKNGFEGSVVARDHPLNNGFDYYFGYNQWESPFYNATNVWENFEPAGRIKEYNTDVFTRKALDFMEKSISEGKPFYIQLNYHAVHSPLEPIAPDRYQEPFDSSSRKLNNFYAHIYGVDENIRLIEEYLAEKGQADNTIFVFTSDNGGAVGNYSAAPGNAPHIGHKGMLHLGGFKVPLFFYWPAGIDKPGTREQLVTTMDVIPTLIDAGGLAVPGGLDGKSLLKLLQEDVDEPVRDFYAVGGIHARVWAFNGRTSFFTHNVSREKAPSGFIVADDQYILRYVAPTIPNLYRDAVDGLPSYYALYDYRKDPGERNNIADQFPEKLQEMKKIWQRESTDFPKPNAWGVDKWEDMMNPD